MTTVLNSFSQTLLSGEEDVHLSGRLESANDTLVKLIEAKILDRFSKIDEKFEVAAKDRERIKKELHR